MIPAAFDYHAPTSLSEALALLGEYGDDAKILAGGHSLLPMMKLRFAEPAHLIDLNGIKEMKGVSEKNGVIHIGAMTTENELIASDLLHKHCPLIPEAAKLIADPQVRNKGTIGGDIAHGDPGNDQPAIMLALNASFVLAGPNSERTVPADGFFLGTYYTQLEASEILTQILIPVPPKGSGHGFAKLKRKTGDFATPAAAVNQQVQGGKITAARVALTKVGPTAMLASEAAAVLIGSSGDDATLSKAAAKAKAICDPAEDLRGSIEYKTQMAGEMARRAIRQALARAKGE